MKNRNIKKHFGIILVFSFYVLTNNTLFAQVSKGGTPPSFSMEELKNQVSVVNMPEVNTDSLFTVEKMEMEQNSSMPFRFGFAIDVNLGLDNSGTWETLSNGDKIWRLKIYSKKAFSINLIYDKFWLPKEAMFFVYSEDKNTVLGAFTAEISNNKFNNFATDIIQGNTVILEYFEPKDVVGGIISIGKIIHGYKNLFGKSNGLGTSGSCNIDINCPWGNNWELEKEAVSMILVNNNTALCTGCLVNNTQQNQTPYYLTANHCYFNSSGGSTSNPATNIFRFKYWRPTCNGANPSNWQSITGATLLSHWAGSDFTLLELSSTPSFPAYYAGWDRRNTTPSSETCIHHPRGGVMKIAVDNAAPSRVSYNAGNGTAQCWRVVWNSGTTEGGSSGSPLFNESHRIIGQLYGGTASCSNMSGHDNYGCFDVSWTGGGTNATRLSNWLDTNNTGVSVLDGCGYNINFTNQTVTANTTVTSCGDINVQNVNVTNGAKLTLDAAGSTTIESGFEMELGSELEIK